MGACVYPLYTHFSIGSDILRVLLLGGVGVIVYGIVLLLLSPAEIRSFMKRENHD